MRRLCSAFSLLALVVSLADCARSDEGANDSADSVEVGSGSEVPNVETPMTTPLTVRLVLEHDTMPAGADSSTQVEARLGGVLHVRNETSRAQSLDFVIPMSHQLEWTLSAEDGTVWKPMFLPPPMPLPNGPPRRTMQLESGAEAPATSLHGISGFFEEARGSADWGPLPAGRYQVVVGAIDFGTGPLQTPPVTLIVQ